MKRTQLILSNALLSKIQDSPQRTLFLGFMAGLYIGVGCVLYGVISNVSGPANLIRFLAALSFTVGLNLVIFKKAQLFTGNNLMVVNLFKKSATLMTVLKNWFLVYIGNFLGSILLVLILSPIVLQFPNLAEHLNSIALKKVNYPIEIAFFKSILCNMLVCLGVYFGVTEKTLPRKVIGIIIPITLFVYLGFEHSIANMFLIPMGLSSSELLLTQKTLLFIGNLAPVTIGNIVGGAIVSIALLKVQK